MLGYMAHGGHGCISVTSNVAPRLCSEFHAAWQKGDLATALKLHDKLMPLHTNLFIESQAGDGAAVAPTWSSPTPSARPAWRRSCMTRCSAGPTPWSGAGPVSGP